MIVERTCVLPSAPGVKPARRQMQEPQDPSQRDARASAIHRTQDSRFGRSVRQTLPAEPTLVAWSHGERQPEQGRELLDASL
ncbi:hypothetical protein [Luteitalea pratensis]|uniref:hypothetical protein n=1 Tax=Luteitalea pratensis TaxID=1855912 RepID=UPI000D72C70F|nr:hypothetical protein [Luteitalea pratensis]